MPHTEVHSHDKFVKKLLSDPQNAIDFFSTYLPSDITTQMDWSTLNSLPKSFVDQGLKETHSDLLFQVHWQGQSSFLYVLFEHQSSRDWRMPLRMLKYSIRIWDDFLTQSKKARKLPPLLPVVFSQVQGGWKTNHRMEDLFDLEAPQTQNALWPYIPKFDCYVVDLSDMDLAQTRGEALQAGLRLLHAVTSRKLDTQLVSVIDLLSKIYAAQGVTELLEAMVHYLMWQSETVTEDVLAKALEHQPELKEEVMNLATHFIQKGIAKGREEGREEGQISVTAKQLKLKYQDQAEAYLPKLKQLPSHQLELVVERILTCQNIEEVFEGF